MARARQKRRAAPTRAKEAEEGRWTAVGRWSAGILSAVIIAAIGAVITAWVNARGPAAVDRLSGGPPIKVGYVAVDRSQHEIALGRPVTDPGERAVLRANASGARHDAVMARHQAAPIEEAAVTVVLTGNRSSLRIVDIEPRILDRGPVADGALLIYSSAGTTDTIELSADLDTPVPRFVTAADRKTPYFRKKQIDLKRDERVTLSLSVKGKAASYAFDLLVTVLAEDRTEQVSVEGPDGGPFRVTGLAGTYRSYYAVSPLGGWQPISNAEACAMGRQSHKRAAC